MNNFPPSEDHQRALAEFVGYSCALISALFKDGTLHRDATVAEQVQAIIQREVEMNAASS